MTLNRKIVVLLFAGISVYTLVGFAFNQFLILPSFLQLEEDEARKDMRRCLEALETQLDEIDLLCFDWAAWDDTYEFIASQDEDYFTSNLIPESFLDNEISFMYFFRRDGTLVWGQFYDLDAGVPVALPDFGGHAWPAVHPLLDHDDRSSVVRGVFRSSRGPLLIVSRPILPSEAEAGEVVRGTMIMGRLVDGRIVNGIREKTQVAVDILDIARDDIPPEARKLAAGEIRIVPDSDAVLRLLTHTHDIYGVDTLVFQVTVPRTILARGRSAIHLNMLAAAIAGFLFLMMLLLSLKWVVTDPLQRLSAHVQRVKLGQGMAVPADMAKRRDEIGDVAREFGHMLTRLHNEESELIAAEAALRRSERRITSILDTAPDAMFLIDRATRIESANGAASALFGYRPDEFPGMIATKLFSRACRNSWKASLARFIGAGEAFQFGPDVEPEGRRQDGGVFPIHVSISSIELEGESLFICAIRDISLLKSMQDKVARNQHLARIGEMGATVAHEIRNPLAGIKGALQILATTDLSGSEGARTIHEMEDLVDRIAHTVEQLLRYARPISLKRCTIFPRFLIEAVSAEPPDGARVSICCEELLHFSADPALLRQVLENVWRNACQSLAPGGAVAWRVDRDGGGVTIILTNDGPEIGEAELLRVFEPFYTTRVDGSGLGLAVSHRIVEAHGGTMWLENTGGRGVSVTIRLSSGE